MEKPLESISKKMIDRYSKRYNDLGKDVKTLGWGSEEQQAFRFKQTLQSSADFVGKSILDIGCGFGDYYDFLKKENIEITSYKGLDINPDLIQEAKAQHKNDPQSSFDVFNILEDGKLNTPINTAVMLGLLNLNLKTEFDNYDYSFKIISNAFNLVDECLIVDFLSANITPEYPKEDFVFYHDPVKMLEFALTLSPNVTLYHNYAPIPQKEFMLAIYK